MNPDERQLVVDEEQLRLLAFFHYVSGGITVAMAAIGGIMFTMLSVMLSVMPPETWAPPAGNDPCINSAPVQPHPPTSIFLGLFAFFLLLILVWGVLGIMAGRYISKRRNRLFSVVVSMPGLLAFPYGTLLAISTLIVLERKSVKLLFETGPQGRAGS